MTKNSLATVLLTGAATIGTGVFFVVKGLSHNLDLAFGVGILSFCTATYFICESAKGAWEEAED